jgi:hypothetical protein
MGSGAAVSGLTQTAANTVPHSATTTSTFQTGTAWLDNTNLLTLTTTGNLLEVNSSTLAVSAPLATVPTGTEANQNTALAYNPAISSKYVFGLYGGTPTTGATKSTLYVFDASNSFNVVNTIDLSTITNVARDLAIDAAGDLFISRSAAYISVIPNAVANALTLTSNSDTKWYQSDVFGSTTNGLDIGLAAVTPPGVQGDYNGNGVVDAADYVVWRSSVGQSTLLNRSASITGTVGAADYNFWRSKFGNTSGSGTSLGGSAVPEPTSALLLLLGLAAFGGRRRAA